MTDAPVATDSATQAPLEPNRAPIVLGLGLLSVFLLIPVGILELGLSGNSFLMGPTSPPGPLVLRVLALLPFWACVVFAFYFATTHRRETTGAMLAIVVGLLCALFSILCGVYLSGFALFPQG